MSAEVDKLGINKLVNVPTSLTNLKTKVDDLDVGKLKTVPVDLKKLTHAVLNYVFKNTKFNTLKTKANCLEKKFFGATTVIHINQYNTDKQNLKMKIEDVENKISDTSSLVTTAVLNAKIIEVENKIPNDNKYITSPEFNKLTAESFEARLKQANLVTKTDFDNKLTNFNKLLQVKQNI